MPAGQPASRRTTIAILITLAAVLTLAVWNQATASAPAARSHVVAGEPPLSEVLAAHEQRGVPNDDIIDHAARTAAAQPPLIEILRAADLLAQAHALPVSNAEPPLIETLQAADQLAKAGLLPAPEPTPVPLIDVLRAASILVEAGVLPPPDGAVEDEAPHFEAPPRSEPPAPPPAPTSTPAPVVAPTPTEPPPPQPPAPEPTLPPEPAPSASGWYDDAFSGHVRDLVNAERAKAGLGAVSIEPRLTLAASRYAKVLSDNDWFSHTGPDGSTLVDRVEAAGFPFDVQIGEVLAWGNEGWGAAEIVRAWLDSPSHREQILSPVYTRAGVACYFTPAEGVTVYCVMDFAG